MAANKIDRAGKILFSTPLPEDEHEAWAEVLRRAAEASAVLDEDES